MTTFYLLILFMLPAVMAVGIAIPRRRELSAQWIGELVIATALLVLGAMLALCRLPVGTVIVSPVVGLSFTFGGFQRLLGWWCASCGSSATCCRPSISGAIVICGGTISSSSFA
ncbi:MAG: hypothetical protein ACLR39_00075 [Oscillospiraceae bacterium]